MHNDDRFQNLSRPRPNGQSLWGYLLYGPRTVLIPGLLPISLATIADDFHWPLVATKQKWEEIACQGMARLDKDGPLIWLPNALKHNPPQSPNVVRSWRRSYDDEIPPCALKVVAGQHVEVFLQTFREDLTKAFVEAFREGQTRTLTRALVNQEQDQDQKIVQPAEGGALWESPRGGA
jgi:hypothetical protein